VTGARYLDDDEISAIVRMRGSAMSKFDAFAAALESRDWSGAQVVDRRRGASVVQSVRFSRS
jgi:hypothetical protein